MAKDTRFADCDSATVFKAVSQTNMSSDGRSLWDRLQEELKSKQSPDAAAEYIRSSLLEISNRLKREIARVTAELG
jgi:hypothetical protein